MATKMTFYNPRLKAYEELQFKCRHDAEMVREWMYLSGAGLAPQIELEDDNG